VYRNGFTSPKDMQFQRSQAPEKLTEEDKIKFLNKLHKEYLVNLNEKYKE
jgi:hypothetical protein